MSTRAVAGIPTDRLILYAGLGIGAYVLLTKVLPDLLKNIGKGAGVAAAGAVTGAASGAGTAAGSIVMAAPTAINSMLEYFGLPPDSLQRAGSAIGTGLFELFYPGANDIGETQFYIVTFPDGQRHSVPASTVSAQGRFIGTSGGKSALFQLLTGPDGKRYASPV